MKTKYKKILLNNIDKGMSWLELYLIKWSLNKKLVLKTKTTSDLNIGDAFLLLQT